MKKNNRIVKIEILQHLGHPPLCYIYRKYGNSPIPVMKAYGIKIYYAKPDSKTKAANLLKRAYQIQELLLGQIL